MAYYVHPTSWTSPVFSKRAALRKSKMYRKFYATCVLCHLAVAVREVSISNADCASAFGQFSDNGNVEVHSGKDSAGTTVYQAAPIGLDAESHCSNFLAALSGLSFPYPIEHLY